MSEQGLITREVATGWLPGGQGAAASVGSAAALFGAAAFLFLVGWLVTRLVPRLWFVGDRGGFTAHRIFVGQLLLLLWVYLRSLLNHLVDVIVPIGWADWLGLVILLAVLVHRREGLREAWRSIAAERLEHAVGFFVVGVLLLVACRNELPRVVMLSSDPDQHAFFARQIQRFGTLPYFTQFHWGPRDFDYPGGFAVLNFIWTSLSRLDVRDVVQVQGLLQTQLGMMALAETLAPAPLAGRSEAARRIAALFLLFLAYYRFLPYGYQLSLYHLEGAGRTASISFLAIGLCFALSLLRRLGDRESLGRVDLFTNGLFAGAVLACAGLLNIVSLPYFAVPFLLGSLLLLGVRPSVRRILGATSVLPMLGLLLLDPYYLKRLLRPGEVYYKSAEAAGTPPSILGIYLSSAWGTLSHLGEAVAGFFRTSLVDPRWMAVLLAVLVAATAVLLLARALAPRDAAALGMVIAFAFLAHLFLSPLGEALRRRGSDFYLMAAYMDASRQQLVVLWLYACLAAIFMGVTHRLSVPIAATAAALVVLALALLHNGQVPSRSRRNYAGSMGTVSEDDLTVIRGIERTFQEYRRAGAPLTFERVPKILIPNTLMHMGGEHWLFPHGASRILPLYDVFPVAFFYFQGSKDYFYESYLTHICERFDENWLAERGIRYLFLPSDRGTPCVSDLDSVLERSRILLRQGQSLFVELPGPR